MSDFDDARVRRAVGYKPDSDACEVDRLNRIAVERCVEEQRKLAKMSPEERARYINDWASRLGPQLAEAGTAHDRAMNEPRVSLPLHFARRILAALELQAYRERCAGYAETSERVAALAAELRANLPKEPK